MAVAIRYGLLKHKDGKCIHPPTPQEPLILSTQFGKLTHCPCGEIPDDIWQFIATAEQLEAGGLPPTVGGWCDQSAQFQTAYTVWREYEAQVTAKMRPDDGR